MTRTNIFRKAALFLAAALLTSPAFAQSSTQGAIGGTVEDATSAIVPGATITIHNNGTNAEQHLTADSSGYYKAPLLEPGTYTVTVASPSFQTYIASQVIVQVAQLTTVDPKLTTGATSTVVEVTAAAPILNFDSPDFSSNLNKEALESIPINNRRWSSLAMTTPGVVDNGSGFGLVSVRGINGLLNSVLIDGADDNQAYFSEERGRTREAYSTSGAAVREFAVNTGVYSSQYGRAAGAVITSVTRSGDNQIHAEAYFYDRESKWNAYNDFAKLTTAVQNPTTGAYTFPSTPLKPKDLRKIYGFTVSGPIIKDKLFYTYTYDQHTRIFPGQAIPSSASTFYTLPNATTAGVCSYTTGLLTGDTNALDQQLCTLAARTGQTYAGAYSTYQAGIVNLLSDLGTVPRFGDQEINTPKLDYQINDREHVEFLFHRLRWDSPGGVQTSATNDYAVDTWGNDFVKLDYGVAKLTSLLSTNISNELLYQYSRELDDETQQPYSAYTTQNLQTTNGNVPEVALDTGVFGYLGSPYYSYRTAYPDERKWQVGDVLHYTKGNHNLTFGGDALANNDLLNNLYESNGYISYSYLGNYFADLYNFKNGAAKDTCNSTALATATATTSAVGSDPCYSSTVQGFGASPEFAISTLDYSFFGQDNWKVKPRLSLQLGVRYDQELLPTPSATLTAASTGYTPFPGVANKPSDKNNVGVRVGFSYDLFGTGNTVLRGGYGIFYGRLTNALLLNTELNTGSPLGQYTSKYTPSTAGAPTFPNLVTTAGAPPIPGVYYFAPNLQDPQVQEYDLLLQQQLSGNTVLSVSYLGSLGRELTNFLDENLDPTTMVNQTITVTDASGKGPLGPTGTVYSVPTYTKYGNAALFGSVATKFQNITQITSNINSNYNALVGEIQNRSIKHLQFDLNYTWAHALDYAQNGSSSTSANSWYDPYSNPRANYGNSSFNVPNRLVGYVLYTLPGFSSHSWYTYATNGWSIDDTYQAQSGLPYSANVTGSTTAAAFGGSDWNGAGGLSIVPGIIHPNTYKLPRKQVDDLRVSKQFSLYKDYKLDLFAQVFNVANHQNYDVASTTAYKLSGATVTAQTALQAGTTPFGSLTSSNNSGFLYTPRQIEIAAKFTF